MSDRFLYFAFGSNLKSKRVKINSPSAEFVGWAVLDNFRLAFAGLSKVFLNLTSTPSEEIREYLLPNKKLSSVGMARALRLFPTRRIT